MNDELIKSITDMLCRVEGAIRINEQGNSLLVDRKLQGLKDKLVHMLAKVSRKQTDAESRLVSAVKDSINSEDNCEANG